MQFFPLPCHSGTLRYIHYDLSIFIPLCSTYFYRCAVRIVVALRCILLSLCSTYCCRLRYIVLPLFDTYFSNLRNIFLPLCGAYCYNYAVQIVTAVRYISWPL
jgi:hypothetical protein